MLGEILLVFAFVFFCIAAFWGFTGQPNPGPFWGRFNPIAAGLACWVLVTLIGGLHR